MCVTFSFQSFLSVVDYGDYVVVTNARKLVVSGKKADQLVYRHHSMFPGGLHERKFKNLMKDRPEEVRVLPSHCLPIQLSLSSFLLSSFYPISVLLFHILLFRTLIYLTSFFMGLLSCSPLTVLFICPTSQILRLAVSGMLPKNTLRDRRMERLKIFEGPEIGGGLGGNITTSWGGSLLEQRGLIDSADATAATDATLNQKDQSGGDTDAGGVGGVLMDVDWTKPLPGRIRSAKEIRGKGDLGA